jgi:hypothetical protein
MQNTARQTRENRTITVDFRDEATYFQLLGDGKAFLECVLAFVQCPRIFYTDLDTLICKI